MLSTPAASIRRYAAVALYGLFALVVPAAAGAESLRADLDGDGVHDRIEISRRPGVLSVRLSGARHSLELRTNDLIVSFVVADIDRDGDSDVVAETRRSGLHIWINKGNGRFAFRSPRLRTYVLRARHFKPIVRGIQQPREDDSALNDPNRLLIVLPSPVGDRLVAAGPVSLTASAPLSRFTHRGRPPRGPPSLLFS